MASLLKKFDCCKVYKGGGKAINVSHVTFSPGQNIWNKTEKYSKTEQGKKSLISTFESFVTAIAKA